jgi:hypothetical protein
MMSSVLMPICKECTRYHGINRGRLTCDAYPDGIPRDILHSIADHTKPLPGDHGLQFEPTNPSAPGARTRNPLLLRRGVS